MASKNAIIVTVLGDTSKLKSELNSAQQQINRFAGRSKIRSTGADPLLADIRQMRTETDELAKRAADVEARSQQLNASFARTAAGALAAGFAINALGRNFQELGGNTAKFGNALSDLTSGNLVGFVKGIQSINTTDVPTFTRALLDAGDAAAADAAANKLAAAGFDDLAASAKSAAAEIRRVADATRQVISFSSIQGTFGVTPLDPLLGKNNPQRRGRGITQEQRNQFFDNDITRALDRAQDGDLKDQVGKLRQVEATLQERLKVTKDITRQLRLEDEIAGVRRQRRGIEDTIARNAKQRAEDAARAAAELKKQQEERAKMLAEMRRAALQAKQFRAIGFAADGSDVVPSADNLRKQLSSLTERLGSSSVNLSSKLENQLDGVRKVLSGKFGQVTRESRDRIAELFDTIRGEFDKQGNGPLTKTTQLSSEKILAGLGLSPADERTLRARLSHFNSEGKALPGTTAGSQTIVVQAPDVHLDGRKISQNTSKHQARKRRANTARRNGPNAGVVIN